MSLNISSLESSQNTGRSFGCLIVTLAAIASILTGVLGYSYRDNQVLEEMKNDPIGWVNRLPLEKIVELKKYLESFPDELTPQTVLPEVETVEKPKNPQ